MIDIERARTNPAAVFEEPRDVLDCDDLSRDDKIAVLRQWRYDALLGEVAQEENMQKPGGTPLEEIVKALEALGYEGDDPSPTKHGEV